MSTAELAEVRIIGFPLRVFERSQEHHDELMREFELITLAATEDNPPDVPRRLIELIHVLRSQYSDGTSGPEAERDAALAAGKESVDLVYHVPPNAGEASRRLAAMLNEADDFCRNGAALLTLATPPEAKAFRDWYLGEFIAQLSGSSPTPWPEWAAQHAVPTVPARAEA